MLLSTCSCVTAHQVEQGAPPDSVLPTPQRYWALQRSFLCTTRLRQFTGQFGEVLQLATTVITRAIKLIRQYCLFLDQHADRIGQLDLAASPPRRALQQLEDAWRQDVATNDGQITRRIFRF